MTEADLDAMTSDLLWRAAYSGAYNAFTLVLLNLPFLLIGWYWHKALSQAETEAGEPARTALRVHRRLFRGYLGICALMWGTLVALGVCRMIAGEEPGVVAMVAGNCLGLGYLLALATAGMLLSAYGMWPQGSMVYRRYMGRLLVGSEQWDVAFERLDIMPVATVLNAWFFGVCCALVAVGLYGWLIVLTLAALQPYFNAMP